MDPITIACPCPKRADGSPRHISDTVTLRDRLDFLSGQTIQKAIGLVRLNDPDASMEELSAEILATNSKNYLLFGIEDWSLTDSKGKTVEVTRPAIRALLGSGIDLSGLVNTADEQYSRAVFGPLLEAAQNSSLPGPTDGSTSAPTGLSRKPPRRSRRSSTSTSPTAGTATITSLHAGDSNSSRSAKSAR